MQGTPEDHNATAGSEHCSHDDSQIINVGFQICNHKDLLVRKESKCTKKKKKSFSKARSHVYIPTGHVDDFARLRCVRKHFVHNRYSLRTAAWEPVFPPCDSAGIPIQDFKCRHQRKLTTA